MLIQRIAQPPAAEYALHLSIYYCVLNPQRQSGGGLQELIDSPSTQPVNITETDII